MNKGKTRHITILGAFSGRNKGDLAILRAELSSIVRSIQYPLVLHVLSKSPKILLGYLNDIIAESHNVEIRINGALTGYIGKSTLGVLLKSDRIIVGGGGLLFDSKLFNITISHLLNLFLLLPLLKATRKKTFVYCIGCSNFNSKLAHFMARSLMNHTQAVYVRDNYTLDVLTRLSTTPVLSAADPSLLLGSAESTQVCEIFSTWPKKPIIILCLHKSVFALKKVTDSQGSLRRFCSNLHDFAERKDYVVLTYSNHTEQKFAKELAQFAPDRFFPLLKEENHLLPEEIIALFSKANFVIASPMHPCIFSYLANIPFLSIPYAQKVEQFNLLVNNDNILSVEDMSDERIVTDSLEKTAASKPLPHNQELHAKAVAATAKLIDFINDN